ncbi:MAG TPA: MgtC/SapB family protein [Tepidisphaeraceae bacterium]|jgi:putative Mg2+ transporter-C (MgtC) family protein
MVAYVDPIEKAVQAFSEHAGFPIDMFSRMLVAMLAGGLVGLEREIRGRQAGFRTNLLVGLGSALVMIVSTSLASQSWSHPSNVNINIDPARIAYGVMTGIGFLGAGAIIKNGSSIRGLTTAAGLWCVAAIGLAAGMGLYVITALATALVLLSLWLLDYVEDILPKIRYRNVTVRTRWTPGCVAQAVKRVKLAKLYVADASFHRTPDMQEVDISLQIGFISSEQYYALERALQDDPNYELLSAVEV